MVRANDPVHFDETHGVWAAVSYDAVREASIDRRFSNAGAFVPTTGRCR